jgi:hypothetical protein
MRTAEKPVHEAKNALNRPKYRAQQSRAENDLPDAAHPRQPRLFIIARAIVERMQQP